MTKKQNVVIWVESPHPKFLDYQRDRFALLLPFKEIREGKTVVSQIPFTLTVFLSTNSALFPVNIFLEFFSTSHPAAHPACQA